VSTVTLATFQVMTPLMATALFWVAAAFCLVAQLALVWSAIRAPMPGNAEVPVKLPSRTKEIAWTIVPALALAVLLVFTWRAIQPSRDAMPGMNMSTGHRTIEE
jgi:heme/copper-type cytochrome/quinol oxidase subunit 2